MKIESEATTRYIEEVNRQLKSIKEKAQKIEDERVKSIVETSIEKAEKFIATPSEWEFKKAAIEIELQNAKNYLA
ncbi:hypothetical protein [Aureibacter tunicatorum]|uniref:F420-0:gamma-glutamyl ligase n=1 Tax=Aureibacter tunicatorum TaxID=866807 RepID=A0AAE3XNX1_9BACT|nr:hypothetical protein [Aureibacter tunicatorum]MDR6239960.1 F420-0:gamma-glutamyl ligase [Aureibacter tunicatorum]BDD04433.1 hypothetical protein AUTU_19160 [Aureibacter tunicatorum]